MADWFVRSRDGARARLIGVTETEVWPPYGRVLELEGKDGERFRISDWAFTGGWSRSEPLEYSSAELRDRRRRL